MSKNIMYYQNGENIIRSGQLEQRMYIILEGRVSIILQSGDEQFVVATMEKGDFFGEISLFTDHPRSATVRALGDVKLAYIDNINQLKAFLIKNPAFAAKMVQILARRVAKTDEILVGKISEIKRLKQTQAI
ncbi:MAG TPA: cyclic nucleotide-binding domain-containing protein [Spirochaetota bacterium]|nr:cyclic nucleotide-binding domain-containing protein [Spirochaetota bacterium]HPJ33707.1 cyclic nucleotide-binding domain-containing protein [Spirochaetota bacterium]